MVIGTIGGKIMRNNKNLPILFAMLLVSLASCGHEHTWDEGTITKQPTEFEEGIKEFKCEGCEEVTYEEIAKLPHSHTFAEEWSYDSTSHWHVSNCGHGSEIDGKADHTWDEGTVSLEPTYKYEGTKTYNCTVCDAIKTETIDKVAHEHIYDVPGRDHYFADATHHWEECDLCGEKKNVEEHIGGEATCVSKAVCDVCNKTYGDLKPHNVDATKFESNEAGHWNVCSNGDCEEKSSMVGHNFNRKVVKDEYFALDATCVEGDKYYYSCDCGLKGTETFEYGEPLGHVGGTATCKDLAICSRCVQPYGEYAEHNYTNLTARKEPTCENAGMEAHYRCLTCAGYFTEYKTPATEQQLVIAALNHFLIDFEDGTHYWKECARENCDYKTEVQGHVYNQQVVSEDYFAKEATCEHAKQYYYSCLCGKKSSTTFGVGEPLQHQYGDLVAKVEATCVKDGMEAYYQCSGCSNYFDSNKNLTTKSNLIIKELGHSLVENAAGGLQWKECEREGCDYESIRLPVIFPSE